jgi:hypothetical protein
MLLSKLQEQIGDTKLGANRAANRQEVELAAMNAKPTHADEGLACMSTIKGCSAFKGTGDTSGYGGLVRSSG